MIAVAARKLEHAVVQAVEARERDELELVAHGAELALEAGNGPLVDVAPPVERGRAVVGEHLARELAVDGLCEGPRLGEIGGRGLHPQEVGVGREGEAARDAARHALTGAQAVEAFCRALACDEGAVALVDIAGDELGAVRIGARDDRGGRAANVGREPRRAQVADVRLGRDQHLAAHVAALLLGRELVLEVDAADAGLDVGLGDLEGVERPAEAGLRIRHDRREPVRGTETVDAVDLVGALQRTVDAPRERRAAVGRVEALVGIGLPGAVGVRSHLPAREVNRLEAGAHHLHGLAAGHRAEGVNVIFGGEQMPEPARGVLGE